MVNIHDRHCGKCTSTNTNYIIKLGHGLEDATDINKTRAINNTHCAKHRKTRALYYTDGVLLISEVDTDCRGRNGRFHKAASVSQDAHASFAAFSSNLVLPVMPCASNPLCWNLHRAPWEAKTMGLPMRSVLRRPKGALLHSHVAALELLDVLQVSGSH